MPIEVNFIIIYVRSENIKRVPSPCQQVSFLCNRFDGNFFADMLERSTADRVKRGKPPNNNRYYHYCSWAHALMVSEAKRRHNKVIIPPLENSHGVDEFLTLCNVPCNLSRNAAPLLLDKYAVLDIHRKKITLLFD